MEAENEATEATYLYPSPYKAKSIPVDSACSPKSGYKVTVEPTLFLYVVSTGAMIVTLQSFIFNTICENREHNATQMNCANLTAHKKFEAEVHAETVQYVMYNTTIHAGLLVVYSLVLGEWTKQNGCKSAMILSLIGIVMASLYLVLLSCIGNTDASLILLGSIPIGLTGGNLVLTTATFSYVSEITSEKNRSFRIAVLQASSALGIPVGLLIGAEVLRIAGYSGVFILSSSLQGSSLLYTIFFVKNDGPDILKHNMCRGVCNANTLRETKAFLGRSRKGSKRSWIILVIIFWSLRVMTTTGMYTVEYLYTMLKFGWSSYEYTYLIVVDNVLTVSGILLASFVGIKLLKMHDTSLGILSTFSMVCGPLLLAFATTGWMAYLAMAFQMFKGVLSVVVRTLLSKLVNPDEVARAFLLIGILETVLPLAAASPFGLIYTFTFSVFPGAVFLVIAGVNAVVCMMCVYLAFVVPETEPEIVVHSDSIISARFLTKNESLDK